MEVWDEIDEEPSFIYDNAPVHTKKWVTNWLEGEQYAVMKWHSPDLSPIEHIWRKLKILLQISHPDVKFTPGGPDTINSKLAELYLIYARRLLLETLRNWQLICHGACRQLLKQRGGIPDINFYSLTCIYLPTLSSLCTLLYFY